MNPAGQVIYHLRRKCRPELSTQAWCKFHEIVAGFPLVPLNRPEINTLHLCEAPGAFITSFNHFLYNSGGTLKKISRASEVGSPTNPPWAPGSDKTRGQGSFGPLAMTTYKNIKKKRTVHLTRFLLRQGEPGTSQYIISMCKI